MSTLVGSELSTLLVVPVYHPPDADRLVLVACLVNKTISGEDPNEDDVDAPETECAVFSDDDRAKVSLFHT